MALQEQEQFPQRHKNILSCRNTNSSRYHLKYCIPLLSKKKQNNLQKQFLKIKDKKNHIKFVLQEDLEQTVDSWATEKHREEIW